MGGAQEIAKKKKRPQKNGGAQEIAKKKHKKKTQNKRPKIEKWGCAGNCKKKKKKKSKNGGAQEIAQKKPTQKKAHKKTPQNRKMGGAQRKNLTHMKRPIRSSRTLN